MYAFIDVNDYQKVIVTDVSKGINEAAKNYLKNAKITSNSQNKSETITIKKIETAVINGNTYYFITDENNKKYKASIELSDELPFKKGGDKLNHENKLNPISKSIFEQVKMITEDLFVKMKKTVRFPSGNSTVSL